MYEVGQTLYYVPLAGTIKTFKVIRVNDKSIVVVPELYYREARVDVEDRPMSELAYWYKAERIAKDHPRFHTDPARALLAHTEAVRTAIAGKVRQTTKYLDAMMDSIVDYSLQRYTQEHMRVAKKKHKVVLGGFTAVLNMRAHDLVYLAFSFDSAGKFTMDINPERVYQKIVQKIEDNKDYDFIRVPVTGLTLDKSYLETGTLSEIVYKQIKDYVTSTSFWYNTDSAVVKATAAVDRCVRGTLAMADNR